MKRVLAGLFSLILVLSMSGFTVFADEARPYIEFSQCPLQNTLLRANQDYELAIKLENTGDADAKDVKLALTGFSEYTVTTEVDAGNIPVNVNGNMFPKNNATWVRISIKNIVGNGKSYPLQGVLTYSDNAGNNYTNSFEIVLKTYNIYANETNYEIYSSENAKPKLYMTKYEFSKNKISAGDTFKLDYTLKNNSPDMSAYDISLYCTPSDSNVLPTKTSDLITISKIGAFGLTTQSLELKVADKAATGMYNVVITAAYRDVVGGIYNETFTIPFKVDGVSEGETKLPKLAFENAKLSSGNIVAGNNFNASITLKNISDVKADNVFVYIANLSKDTISSASVAAEKSFDSIEPGKSAEISFSLIPNKDLSGGVYDLTVNAVYYDNDGKTYNAESKIYVPVKESENKSDDKKNSLIPRVILSSYKVTPDVVVAGQDFSFDFALKNTSRTTSVNNIKIKVVSNDGIYTPVEGSNTFFTEKLDALENVSYSIDLTPKASAEAKSYPVTIMIDYQDKNGNSYSSEENISMYVSQPYRFEISNFYYQPTSYGMYPTSLSLQYFNKGKSALANLTVSVEGDFTTSDGQEMYIGNFPSSSYDYLDINVTPSGFGMQNGVLVFSFEDAAGKLQRVEQPFAIEVMEESIPSGDDVIIDPDMPVDPIEDESFFKKNLKWIIIAGSVIVVGAAVIIIVKAKKKKAKLQEDEDDAD